MTEHRRRRAKIVCTLGPAVDDDATLEALVRAGMDAARLNLSYGTHAEHEARVARVRDAAARSGRPIAIIADIPGPKVRLGPIDGGGCALDAGQTVRFSHAGASIGTAEHLIVGDGFFYDDMIRGDRILLSDGLVELEIVKVGPYWVDARVLTTGDVAPHTGVHLPSVFLRRGPITDADRPHLEFAVKHAVDYVALTYVRDGADLLSVREVLEGLGAPNMPLIAKIERPEAFARLDGILERADAVMIRRGDLGAHIELTRVPAVQKEVVRLANQHGVPVIIATQMLGSMIAAPRPTRAEASDVSNAIVDGADGVMLSSETAAGRYPLDAVNMMHRIIVATEQERQSRERARIAARSPSFDETTAASACQAALQCGAKLIAAFTESGRTAGLVAKYRPPVPIVALCRVEAARRKLALHWGVRSTDLEPGDDAERMVESVDESLLAGGWVKHGDPIVIVYGAPVGLRGHTNSLRLHRVGRRD